MTIAELHELSKHIKGTTAGRRIRIIRVHPGYGVANLIGVYCINLSRNGTIHNS